jgi:hypothetical protein
VLAVRSSRRSTSTPPVERTTGVKVARAASAEALIRLGLRAVAKPRKAMDPLEQLAAAERKR